MPLRIFALLCCLICLSHRAAADDTDPSLVIDRYVQHFVVATDGGYRLTVEHAKTIAQQRAVQEHSQYYIGYNRSLDEVESIDAHTRKPDGRLVPVRADGSLLSDRDYFRGEWSGRAAPRLLGDETEPWTGSTMLGIAVKADLLEIDIDGVHRLIGGAARKERGDGSGGNKMCQTHRQRSIKKTVERGVPVQAVHRESIFPYTSQNINLTKRPCRKRSRAHEYGQGWTVHSIFTVKPMKTSKCD